MTDRIDLDDLETGDDGDETAGNRGDWLWRDDESAEPVDERDSPSATTAATAESADTEGETAEGESAGPDRAPAPHVPKTGESTPVGIPTAEGGDGGGGTGSSGATGANGRATAGASNSETLRPMGAEPSAASDAGDETEPASGPHGGGADDMTMAITYGALGRLARPAAVFASAYEWSDWVGIVGDVPAHVIQKFQRDRGIDVDFFNGTGTGPGERLAAVDRNSMFFAERMVVVGLRDEDEPIAEAADWEFVPLETAAGKADWELADAD